MTATTTKIGTVPGRLENRSLHGGDGMALPRCGQIMHWPMINRA